MIRVEEFRIAVDLIQQALQRLPEGPVRNSIGPLPAWEPAWGMVEGWRGGIIHWVMADTQSRLYRVKIKDPSFLNWKALSEFFHRTSFRISHSATRASIYPTPATTSEEELTFTGLPKRRIVSRACHPERKRRIVSRACHPERKRRIVSRACHPERKRRIVL